MPVHIHRKHDLTIANRGFMLVRSQYGGRAWSRTGDADSPGMRSSNDSQYGTIQDEREHPEVWDDWSGGYGHAYRSQATPNTYHWSENFDPRHPGMLVHCLEPQLVPAGSININVKNFLDVPLTGVEAPPIGAGTVLVYGKGFVAAYTPTGLTASPFTTQYEASGGGATTFGGRAGVMGSYVYIGTEGSPFVRRSFNAVYTIAPLPGEGFAVVAGQMWRRHSKFLVQSVAFGADPLMTGNWSATLMIGNGQHAIKDLTSLGDQLYAGMPDGLHAGSTTGTFYNVLPGPEGAPNADNGRDLDSQNYSILGPFADDLVMYQPSELGAQSRSIGPYLNNTDRTPLRGRLRCVRAFGPWAYSGLWTGSQSYLLAGRWQGDGIIWHTQQRLPHVARVSRIHFDGVTTNSAGTEIPSRCWVATDCSGFTGTAPLYYWHIPRLNNNTLGSDMTFTPRYCGSARMDLGNTDWKSPGTLKYYREVEIWADNLASGHRWCDVYYTTDWGTREYLGRAATSPKSTLYFPSYEGSFITGQSIEVSMESFTASPRIVSPVYRAIVLRGQLLPKSNEVITAVIRIADNMRDRQGNPMRQGAIQIQELRDMTNPRLPLGRVPQIITDLAGATYWVKPLPPLGETEYYQEGDQDPELAVTMRMSVVEMTINTAANVVLIEDIGSIPAS